MRCDKNLNNKILWFGNVTPSSLIYIISSFGLVVQCLPAAALLLFIFIFFFYSNHYYAEWDERREMSVLYNIVFFFLPFASLSVFHLHKIKEIVVC